MISIPFHFFSCLSFFPLILPFVVCPFKKSTKLTKEEKRERTNESIQRKWGEKNVLKWNKLFFLLLLFFSGLLDIQFHFSVLKFTLENEISFVIESRIFVFRTYSLALYCMFDWWTDSILLKSFNVFTETKSLSTTTTTHLWIVKSLRENSNLDFSTLLLFCNYMI